MTRNPISEGTCPQIKHLEPQTQQLDPQIKILTTICRGNSFWRMDPKSQQLFVEETPLPQFLESGLDAPVVEFTCSSPFGSFLVLF